MSYFTVLIERHNRLFGFLNYLQNPLLLFTRLYMAWVFFKAGLTKLNSWDSTLFLFEYEYQVPLLPFETAAILATLGEIILPLLLTVGLFTRISALGLTIINAVAVYSYTEMVPAALNQHIFWAFLLAVNIIYGAGKVSADKLLKLN